MIRVEENDERRSSHNYVVEDTAFWEEGRRRGEGVK